jgi:hypothetical protein
MMIALAVEFRIGQEPTETGWLCEQRLASEPSIIAEPL